MLIVESLRILASLTPVQVAAVMFGLGLLFGSYSFATYLRLASSGSPTGPRSQCPRCRHTLGFAELVPLLSYLWLRGRCRACRVRIPVSYPAAELALGLLAAVGGLRWGWLGGAAAIAFGLGLALAAGLWNRRHTMARGSPGMALLENLVAIALITTMFAPVLNTFVSARVTVDFAQERMIMNGLARQRLNQLESAARLSGTAPVSNETVVEGDYTLETTEVVELPTPSGEPWAGDLYQVTILVTRTCAPSCTDRFGGSPPQVRQTSYLWVK